MLPSGIVGTVLPRWDMSADVHHYTESLLSVKIGKKDKHRPYHSWQLVFRNPADFMKSWDIAFPLHSMKLKSFCWVIWFIRFSGGFHEIHMKSAWNPPDFMKFSWNPPDFKIMSFWVIIQYRSFFRNVVDVRYWWIGDKLGGELFVKLVVQLEMQSLCIHKLECKATTFLFVGLHHTDWNFKVRWSE